MHSRSLHTFGLLLALPILIGCAQPPATVVTPTTERLTPTTQQLAPTIEQLAVTPTVATPAPAATEATPESSTVVTETVELAPITPLATTEIVDRPLRNVRALTDGTTKYRLAQWSPDGGWIAVTPQDGPGLDAINSATGEVVRVVADSYVLEPLWADERTLLVHALGAAGDELIAYRLDDSGVSSDTLARSSSPIRGVGADGGVIAYGADGALHVVSHAAAIDATFESLDPIISAPRASDDALVVAINPFVANLEQIQTLLVRLSGGHASVVSLSDSGEGLWLPRPSPDATRLALTSIEARIVTTTIDGGARHDLGPGDQPAWSPDGERIVYIGANAGTEWISRDLYIVDWQGQGPRVRLTDAVEGEFFSSPSWSPDGQRIAFVEIDSGRVFIGDAP